MNSWRKVISCLTGCLLLAGWSMAQNSPAAGDSAAPVKKKRDLKNTVWFNLTNPVLLSDKSLIFGYERILGPKQSFTFNIGETSLPDFSLVDLNIQNDNLTLSKNTKDKGANLSVDYRFYLLKVNRYNAPRGVYFAPYYSYNFFERTNTWTLHSDAFDGDLNTKLRLDIHTLGGELGYQFVFWRRLALDFILFGPGMAQYTFKANISTTLNADDQAELFQVLNDYLAEKFPGYNFVIDDQEFKKSGSTKTTTFGFRYMIHLGFRF